MIGVVPAPLLTGDRVTFGFAFDGEPAGTVFVVAEAHQQEGITAAKLVPACQVSWKMGSHEDLIPCRKPAEYRAYGIGNEGDSSFEVCEVHKEVATLYPTLWAVEPAQPNPSDRTGAIADRCATLNC